MPDTMIAGRFRLTEKLGSGGMAEVYKAVDEVLGRTVAVKVMRGGDQDPQFAERFSREAKVLAQLTSPYIVTVHDWGQDDDLHYIVMEYLGGRDLKTVILEDGPLDSNRVAEIGAQVCEALTAAHSNDVVHRDITSTNIMVMADGSVKLTDFGIAKVESASVTQTGMVFGTAHYFSPEQAQGMVPGPASDLYSLGVVLFEAATGEVPFHADSPVAVALKHVNEQPPHPTRLRRGIDPRLEAVILKAMAKRPEDRYQSAADMEADLRGLSGARPNSGTAVLPAVHPAASSGTRRTNARKLLPWFLLAAAIVALGVGLASTRFADDQPNTSEKTGASTESSASRAPDVVGLREPEARSAIERARLVPVLKSREYSSRYGSGTVMAQDPPAGASVTVGSKIQYVVSAGPAPQDSDDDEKEPRGKSEGKGKSKKD